ncbi:MAG: MBL fold metallo-hydrolase [Candidatus Peribacteraceae bacterium]|nr:MBL fold metallo-hydrolase [Candidatus Peribacteraceae bacterium]
MLRVIPLIEGVHTVEHTPQGRWLPGHTGAVTLLDNGEERILIDTGSRGIFSSLLLRLLEEGESWSASSITTVVLTHFHLDHSANLGAFQEARVIGWGHDWRKDGTLSFADIEQVQLMPGVRLMKTPGHAPEHLSVVVQIPGSQTIVIAGDAINEEYARTGRVHAFCYDEALYRRSADQILAIADIIIPGHGAPFANKKT